MTTKAANANSIAMTAMPTAPPKVARPGRISMKSSRTTMTASNATTSANNARRRAHRASRETGSSAMRRRGIQSVSCTDALEGRPFDRVEQRGAFGRRGHIDSSKTILRIGVVEQELHARMIGAFDPPDDGAERVRIAAEPGHQLDRIGIGAALDLARIGRLQERLGGQDDGAAAHEIAQHGAEQERQSDGL